MAEPIFNAKYGIYLFSWPSLGLAVNISRLRESHDVISAEVELKNAGGDCLHIARLNLFSTQAKRTLASHLRQQINSLEWDTLVELVSQATIKEYRNGEPVVEIGALPIRKGPRWRLQGIIPEGDIALLFGPGGSGKSWMALAFSVAVSQGWDGLGLEAEKGNVLYLDWEWGWQEHNDRLRELEVGMDLDFHPHLYYRYCSHKIENDRESIQQIVIEKKISLIIVDSLVPALGGAREAKENAEPLFSTLRAIPDTSALVISHTAKDPLQKFRTPYGDVFSTNRPRHVLEMRTGDDTEVEDGQETPISLWKYKSNLPPALLKGMYPFGFKLVYKPLGTRIERLDINTVPELAKRLSLKSRILLQLKKGAFTKKSLASELNETEQTTQSRLTDLKKAGMVILLPGDYWGLKAKDYV